MSEVPLYIKACAKGFAAHHGGELYPHGLKYEPASETRGTPLGAA
jgi:hypothetical protein